MGAWYSELALANWNKVAKRPQGDTVRGLDMTIMRSIEHCLHLVEETMRIVPMKSCKYLETRRGALLQTNDAEKNVTLIFGPNNSSRSLKMRLRTILCVIGRQV